MAFSTHDERTARRISDALGTATELRAQKNYAGHRLSPLAPPNPDSESRATTLQRVRQDWIDAVLNQSLYRVARIELGLAARDDVVEAPLNAIVQIPDRLPFAISPGTSIVEVLMRLVTLSWHGSFRRCLRFLRQINSVRL